MFIAPADYAAIEGNAGWRQQLGWPLSLTSAYALGRCGLRRIALAVAGLPAGDARDLAAAAAGRVFTSIIPLVEQAYAVAAEGAGGMTLTGSVEADYMRGAGMAPAARGFSAYKKFGTPRWPQARRLARIQSWTPWYRMPAAVLAPDAVAITHNELLREAAREDGVALGFNHAETLFEQVPRGAGLPEAGMEAAHRALTEAMAPEPDLESGIAGRLRMLIDRQVAAILGTASVDLAAVRQVRDLPLNVWAGSGGYWPGRILALEIMRRGGTITRFDHGQNRALHDIAEFPAIIDFFVGDRLVAPTEGIARQIDTPELRKFVPADRAITVSGRPYSRDMAAFLAANRKRGPAAARPCVLYAPNILRGQRQTVPANLPDIVYLDWQFRLVEQLASAKLDLLLRPHPQGIFTGRTHPLAAVHPTRSEPFEMLSPEADVFLFDSPYSRVFCKALITDRPIVYVDFGVPYFAPNIQTLIEQRCVILKAMPDERNRPTLNWGDLADALVAPPMPEKAAVEAFRDLMIGNR